MAGNRVCLHAFPTVSPCMRQKKPRETEFIALARLWAEIPSSVLLEREGEPPLQLRVHKREENLEIQAGGSKRFYELFGKFIERLNLFGFSFASQYQVNIVLLFDE